VAFRVQFPSAVYRAIPTGIAPAFNLLLRGWVVKESLIDPNPEFNSSLEFNLVGSVVA